MLWWILLIIAILFTLAAVGGAILIIVANAMASSTFGSFEGGGIIIGLAVTCAFFWFLFSLVP